MGDLLSPFLKIFAKTKQTQIPVNEKIAGNVNTLAGYMPEDNAKLMSAWADFDKATKARAVNWGNQRDQDQAAYTSLMARSAAANPMADYSTIRNDNLASFKDFAGWLGDTGRRNDSIASQALGFGGKSGTYEKALLADRLGRATAPVLNTIYGNLGSDTATIGNQRLANLSYEGNAIGARAAANDYGAGLELLPANALLALRDAEIGQQGRLVSDVAKPNIAGYRYDQNAAGRVADAMSESWDNTLDSAGKVASIAGSVMGLGGVGGIASGLLGGGGGAKAQPQQNLSPAYQAMTYQPVNYAALSSPSAASYSPYGVYGMPQSPYSYLRY